MRRLLLALLLLAHPAPAAVFDEFEVHGTDIATPGETALDLFSAYGLRGIRRPAWHGGLAGDRAFYLSPMLSHGAATGWETALLLPLAVDPSGATRAGGAKWHNVVVAPVTAGPFSFGAVLELTAMSHRFQPMTFGWEVRPLVQYREGPWVARLTLGFTGGFVRRDVSAFSPSAALMHQVTERLALGLEHYAELGRVLRPEPARGQAQQLFAVAEWREEAWFLKAGIGRGLTPVSEPWVASAHVGVGF